MQNPISWSQLGHTELAEMVESNILVSIGLNETTCNVADLLYHKTVPSSLCISVESDISKGSLRITPNSP